MKVCDYTLPIYGKPITKHIYAQPQDRRYHKCEVGGDLEKYLFGEYVLPTCPSVVFRFESIIMRRARTDKNGEWYNKKISPSYIEADTANFRDILCPSDAELYFYLRPGAILFYLLDEIAPYLQSRNLWEGWL